MPAASPYFDRTYFDPTYFDANAATAAGGRSGRSRIPVLVAEPAAEPQPVNDDDEALIASGTI